MRVYLKIRQVQNNGRNVLPPTRCRTALCGKNACFGIMPATSSESDIHPKKNSRLPCFENMHSALALMVLFCLLACPAWAFAQSANLQPVESIQLFDVTARLQRDGSMKVEEVLTLHAQGRQIRHGIERVLPLLWKRADNKYFLLAFQNISASLDGMPARIATEREGQALHIRVGDAQTLLVPGTYRLTLCYTVSNHFSRFSGWDEIYWNVTGNAWRLPIEQVRFRLVLPDETAGAASVSALPPAFEATWQAHDDTNLSSGGIAHFPLADSRLRSIDAYTGSLGRKGKEAHILKDGSIVTTQALEPGEGLTVAYTFSPEVLANVAAPEPYRNMARLFVPESGSFIYLIPGALLLLFFFWRVTKLCRKSGENPTVTPLFEPPAGETPGMLRYVCTGRYDAQALAADLLDLAARGILYIYPAAGPDNGFGKQADDSNAFRTGESQLATRKRFSENPSFLISLKPLATDERGRAPIPKHLLRADQDRIAVRVTGRARNASLCRIGANDRGLDTSGGLNSVTDRNPVNVLHEAPAASRHSAGLLGSPGLTREQRDAAVLKLLFGLETQTEESPAVPQNPQSPASRTPGEGDCVLLLNRSRNALLQALRVSLGRACRMEKKALFLRWQPVIFAALPFAVLLPGLLAWKGYMEAAPIIAFTLFFALTAIFILSMALAQLARGLSPKNLAQRIVPLCFTLLIPAVGLLPPGIMLSEQSLLFPPGMATALLLYVAAPVIFSLTAPQYTAFGKKRLAVAQGLLLYINTAERDRFEALYPPGASAADGVTRFEKLLPYAMALNAAQTWANSFSAYLERNGAAPQRLGAFYAEYNSCGMRAFAGACSAASSSGSSGGSTGGGSSGSGSGGAGSSGGGAGGGGGGGW